MALPSGSFLLKSQTQLQQLLEEINFQRTKEMRQLLKDDSGFVVLQGTTYWTDLFVRHFLFQSEPVHNIDSDDLLFFVRKKHVKGTSRHMPKYETEIDVYRKDSRKLPIGDPDVDWEETVYLNMVIHQFDYTLTLAICTRTSPKELQVLRRHSQRVYASPSRRKMDTKGEGEEITYPHICFMVDNFDEVFSDILVRDGEMVCVELVASDKDGSVQGVIFLGSIRYDALKKVYDARQSSLSSKVAQRMTFGLFSSGAGVQTRCEFVRMKGPQGKGHAEMAVTKPKGSGVETPTSEPGFCATDMWDEWDDEDDYTYRHQRRLSDPSANLNNFSRYGWKTKHCNDNTAGTKARSENEGLDSLANEVSEIEAGDLRDDRPASSASETKLNLTSTKIAYNSDADVPDVRRFIKTFQENEVKQCQQQEQQENENNLDKSTKIQSTTAATTATTTKLSPSSCCNCFRRRSLSSKKSNCCKRSSSSNSSEQMSEIYCRRHDDDDDDEDDNENDSPACLIKVPKSSIINNCNRNLKPKHKNVLNVESELEMTTTAISSSLPKNSTKITSPAINNKKQNTKIKLSSSLTSLTTSSASKLRQKSSTITSSPIRNSTTFNRDNNNKKDKKNSKLIATTSFITSPSSKKENRRSLNGIGEKLVNNYGSNNRKNLNVNLNSTNNKNITNNKLNNKIKRLSLNGTKSTILATNNNNNNNPPKNLQHNKLQEYELADDAISLNDEELLSNIQNVDLCKIGILNENDTKLMISVHGKEELPEEVFEEQKPQTLSSSNSSNNSNSSSNNGTGIKKLVPKETKSHPLEPLVIVSQIEENDNNNCNKNMNSNKNEIIDVDDDDNADDDDEEQTVRAKLLKKQNFSDYNGNGGDIDGSSSGLSNIGSESKSITIIPHNNDVEDLKTELRKISTTTPFLSSSLPRTLATAKATTAASASATANTSGRKLASSISANFYNKAIRIVPKRTTADGTNIYYWCDLSKKALKELDDGAYNPLWTTKGFTQTFHFWKENRRQQSTPLNAFLTYVTLPWWSIAKDLLDHRETPILTF